MRGMGLIDLLVIVAVVALLVFVGSKDFRHYGGRGVVPAPTPSATAHE